MQLVQFFADIRGHRRIADIRVDLALGRHPDPHRLQFRVIDVGRNDEPPGGDFVPDQPHWYLFPLGDKGHLFRDVALARKVHLRHVSVAGPRCFELSLDDPLSPRLQNLVRRVDRRLMVAVSIAAHFRIASFGNLLVNGWFYY